MWEKNPEPQERQPAALKFRQPNPTAKPTPPTPNRSPTSNTETTTTGNAEAKRAVSSGMSIANICQNVHCSRKESDESREHGRHLITEARRFFSFGLHMVQELLEEPFRMPTETSPADRRVVRQEPRRESGWKSLQTVSYGG